VAPKQPINADVPATAQPAAADGAPGPAQPGSGTPPQRGKARPTIAAPLAIAALTALALGLIAAAILAGRGSREGGEAPGPRQPAEALGYPSLATSNTTRIAAADPASRAASVALAVYPSTAAGQRPDAVTLLDASDWRSALAAAVLMATPVRAPLLVSDARGMPEATARAVEALAPHGGGTTHGVQVFALGAAAAPSGLRERRIRATGVAGAVAIAKLRDGLFGAPPKHVVVAPADEPAFAMPAAAWAARSGDPMLFTDGQRLSRPTARELRKIRHARVYVLGPSSAISSRVVREIAKIAAAVRRVSGESPVENSVALARYADGDFGWNLNDPGHGFVVARSNSPLDAAGAAPLSASGTWGALLLTNRADTLPDALRGYLLDVKPGYTTDPTRAFYNHVWVIGDQEAIDVREQAQINELAELTKIGGEQ